MKSRCPKCQSFTHPYIRFGKCTRCSGLIMGNRVITDQQQPRQIVFTVSPDLKSATVKIDDTIKNRLSRFGYDESDLMQLLLLTFFDEMEKYHAENKN